MRARARSLGLIIITTLFFLVVVYTGFELYQLPEQIIIQLDRTTAEKILEAQLLAQDSAKTANERVLAMDQVLKQANTKVSDDIVTARATASFTYYAFGTMLILGLLLIMAILLTISVRKSADTIVYIDKKEEDEGEEQQHHEQASLLVGIEEKILQITPNEEAWGKDAFEATLRLICNSLQAGSGLLYQAFERKKKREIQVLAGYAFVMPDSGKITFEYGEGLAGQVAKTQRPMRATSLPEGYVKVFSGLGEASPPHLTILPILKSDQTIGVLELSTFFPINNQDFNMLETLCQQLSQKLEGYVATHTPSV